MLIVRYEIQWQMGVIHNDRVCGSPTYVCKRRDQRGAFAGLMVWHNVYVVSVTRDNTQNL